MVWNKRQWLNVSAKKKVLIFLPLLIQGVAGKPQKSESALKAYIENCDKLMYPVSEMLTACSPSVDGDGKSVISADLCNAIKDILPQVCSADSKLSSPSSQQIQVSSFCSAEARTYSVPENCDVKNCQEFKEVVANVFLNADACQQHCATSDGSITNACIFLDDAFKYLFNKTEGSDKEMEILADAPSTNNESITVNTTKAAVGAASTDNKDTPADTHVGVQTNTTATKKPDDDLKTTEVRKVISTNTAEATPGKVDEPAPVDEMVDSEKTDDVVSENVEDSEKEAEKSQENEGEVVNTAEKDSQNVDNGLDNTDNIDLQENVDYVDSGDSENANQQDESILPHGDQDTMNSGPYIDDDSNFLAYFLLLSVVCIVAYLVFHNKQKILALILEGRRQQGSRRRSGGRVYRKLDSTVEDNMDLNRETSLRQVIY